MTSPVLSADPARRIAPGLWIALALIALAAVVGPLLYVLNTPRVPVSDPTLAEIARPKRIVPKAELPPVEPVRLAALPKDEAREFNATIPFSTGPNPAARPFIVSGSAPDQARAIDCLAAATWYEAGDDVVGQRAVAQVILNRMRHPAFPKSVCGVVFQGQERRTGCQFTFTCDGAMTRTPSAVAWIRAQEIARMALSGYVVAKVGHSTHYHTDWVVPYWSSSLDKVAEVNTHLFFRWTGWWGTPPAFRRAYAGAEPNIPKMARLSPFHIGGATEATAIVTEGAIVDPATIPDSALPQPAVGGNSDTFYVALDRGMGADAFAALAIRTCGERPFCKFMGWTDPRKVPPAGAALSGAALDSMSFSYLRDAAQGFGKALWNCGEFRRPSPVQCMRRTPAAVAAPVPDIAPIRLDPTPKRSPVPELGGVRRKSEVAPPVVTVPAAQPTPAP
ncbi:cell wall hydrolase [Sphingomonas sp. LT1P40]|uniref:cell wall hydrolase n=1 Tax=Alteristakelama amylovorans TaxID=3096166 RepID=UPI002FC8BC0F